LFDLIKSDPSFADLTKNEFDLSQFLDQEYRQKLSENRVVYKAVHEPEVDDSDQTVEYKYNNIFFRSDDFISNHDGLHVLFSGCSESEGIGDNIEHAWTKILYDKISKETKCSGFFNLSRAGWGWSKIIANALIYFEKFGYPSLYFILLPNHQRMHKFHRNDSESSYWQYEQLYPIGVYMHKDNNKHKKFLSKEKEYKEDFLNFLISWKLFNKVCKDNNVKLIFSTWDEFDSENIANINMFDNFLDMNTKNLSVPYVTKWYEFNEKTKHDLRKRDGHGGIILHNFWADSFYSLWKGSQK
jgi:hypothetical protein